MKSKLLANGPLIVAVVAVLSVTAAMAGMKTSSTLPSMSNKATLVQSNTTPENTSPLAERPKLPDLTAAEERDTIALVRGKWRSEHGETLDQILGNAAKVAHFYHRGPWGAYRDFDGRPAAGITFVTSKAAKDDEAITIYWRVEDDGSITTASRGFKAIDLGSKAFALALIQNEIISEVKGPNTRYLFDPKNLDWLNTDAGALSNLLVRAQCTPVSALHAADYTPVDDHRNTTGRDEWSFDTSVKCRAGPVYCADQGPLIFKRADRGTWQPASTCARLLVGQEPQDFMRPLLREQTR